MNAGLQERRLFLVKQMHEIDQKMRESKVAMRKLIARRRYKGDYSVDTNRVLRELSDQSDGLIAQKTNIQREMADIKIKVQQQLAERFKPNQEKQDRRATMRKLCGDSGEIFTRTFVDVARLILTGEVFEAIKTKAIEQLEQQQQQQEQEQEAAE